MEGLFRVVCGSYGCVTVVDWKTAVNEGCQKCGSHKTEVYERVTNEKK